jgi:hypothetical protein
MSDRKTREAQIARIRALMAKTVSNGCTEEEAKGAAAAVDRLLATYELSLDEINVREQPIEERGVPNTRHHLVINVARAISKFTDTRVWYVGSDLVFFGFKIDTEIAEYLTFVFKRAIDSHSSAYTLFNPEYDRASASGRSEMLRSFGLGMADRLGERLFELKSKRDFHATQTTGRSLVVLKQPIVKAAFDALGLTLGKRSQTRRPQDERAFHAGRADAESVQINHGVAARAQTSGAIR